MLFNYGFLQESIFLFVDINFVYSDNLNKFFFAFEKEIRVNKSQVIKLRIFQNTYIVIMISVNVVLKVVAIIFVFRNI